MVCLWRSGIRNTLRHMGDGQEAKDDPSYRCESLLHDQIEYLLDDQVSYADSLRDSRRTAGGLLLLVIGIGIFRFDLFRPESHVLVVPVWSAWVIRAFVALALLAFLAGAYFIYSERAFHHEFRKKTKGSGGALSVLYLRQKVLDDFRGKQSPTETMKMKTDGLRLAYTRLRDANRRVRQRIAIGTLLLFLGLGCLSVAFGLYTFTVNTPLTGGGAE